MVGPVLLPDSPDSSSSLSASASLSLPELLKIITWHLGFHAWEPLWTVPPLWCFPVRARQRLFQFSFFEAPLPSPALPQLTQPLVEAVLIFGKPPAWLTALVCELLSEPLLSLLQLFLADLHPRMFGVAFLLFCSYLTQLYWYFTDYYQKINYFRCSMLTATFAH